jgi:hypothetical protein
MQPLAIGVFLNGIGITPRAQNPGLSSIQSCLAKPSSPKLFFSFKLQWLTSFKGESFKILSLSAV